MAVPASRTNVGFQAIFAVFLGLILTAFIGVGLYTFYPPPSGRFDDRIRELNREQSAIRTLKSPNEFTEQDRARLQAITAEINKAQDDSRAAAAPWGRNTSIMLIACATLVMAVSLVGAERLPVLTSGLLLGGAFTMIYGVGLILTTNTSIERFLVITAALLITLGLGYVRFVTRRAAPPASAAVTLPALADIDNRLTALEKRMDEAASALGRKV